MGKNVGKIMWNSICLVNYNIEKHILVTSKSSNSIYILILNLVILLVNGKRIG